MSEKETYKKKIADIINAIENTGKLKYIYAILGAYTKNREVKNHWTK